MGCQRFVYEYTLCTKVIHSYCTHLLRYLLAELCNRCIHTAVSLILQNSSDEYLLLRTMLRTANGPARCHIIHIDTGYRGFRQFHYCATNIMQNFSVGVQGAEFTGCLGQRRVRKRDCRFQSRFPTRLSRISKPGQQRLWAQPSSASLHPFAPSS